MASLSGKENPQTHLKGSRISILLVDDNSKFLEIIARFLDLHGKFSILGTAENGDEALAQAQRLQPQVILLDLAMPGMNGLEAIPRLKASVPEVRIIVLSLLDTNGYRQAALAAGADFFISKANMSAQLLPAIHQPRQQASHHDPSGRC